MSKKLSSWLARIVLFSMLLIVGCDDLISEAENYFNSDDDGENIVASVPDAMKVVIGKGYDITGSYAYSPEIKESILDLSKLTADGKVVRDPNLNRGVFETSAGTTITEYQQSLAANVSVSANIGVEMLASFGGEIGSNFDNEIITSDEYAFATISSNITKDAYIILDKDNLTDYLTSQFISDVEKLSPDKIIAKYGTHVMLGGVLGARLDYNMSVKKQAGGDSTKIGAYAKASAEVAIQGIAPGVGALADINYAYSNDFETSTTDVKTKAVGGKPEYAQTIHISPSAESYAQWIASIDGNEVWSDYYPNSLIPIYELIDTDHWPINGDDLRSALYNECNKYFSDKKITVKSSTTKSASYFWLPQINQASGGTVTKLNGDADIYTKDNKDTTWSLEVTLKQNGDYVDAHFVYTIYEGGGDLSILQLTKTEKVYPGVELVKLEKPTYQYIHGTITGQVHDYTSVHAGEDGEILSNVNVKIDGTGIDENNIGVQTGITVYYTAKTN